MNVQANKPFDRYENFLLFLLIHIANADHMFKLDEAVVILSKMEDMFDTDTSVDKLLQIFLQMQDEYDRMSNDEIVELIKVNFGAFNVKGDLADRLFNELYEVINADGHIHEEETKAIEKIKRLVKMA